MKSLHASLCSVARPQANTSGHSRVGLPVRLLRCALEPVPVLQGVIVARYPVPDRLPPEGAGRVPGDGISKPVLERYPGSPPQFGADLLGCEGIPPIVPG